MRDDRQDHYYRSQKDDVFRLNVGQATITSYREASQQQEGLATSNSLLQQSDSSIMIDLNDLNKRAALHQKFKECRRHDQLRAHDRDQVEPVLMVSNLDGARYQSSNKFSNR